MMKSFQLYDASSSSYKPNRRSCHVQSQSVPHVVIAVRLHISLSACACIKKSLTNPFRWPNCICSAVWSFGWLSSIMFTHFQISNLSAGCARRPVAVRREMWRALPQVRKAKVMVGRPVNWWIGVSGGRPAGHAIRSSAGNELFFSSQGCWMPTQRVRPITH